MSRRISQTTEEWITVKLGDLGYFSKGKGIRKDDVVADGIPCVRYGELYTHHHYQIKDINSFITRETANESHRISTGDILFAGSGETKEDIGKCAAFLKDKETYAGGDVIVFSPRKTDPLFLGYLLNQESVTKQKAQFGQGDAIVHIYPNKLKDLVLKIPSSISEQTAIATALSDADALITALEKLIEKKRNIKQAVMQEVLKPKEGWESFTVKELAQIGTGSKNTQDKSQDGLYPFFVRSDRVERINSYSYDGEAILVAGDGVGTGKVIHYYKGKFDYHQRVYKISDFNTKVSAYFFYLYFKANFYNRIMQMTAKSSVDSIRLEMIADMRIQLPSENEQCKISQIIIDIESEIWLIETRLKKQRAIKQGMMQELLNGRTRLI